MGIIGGADGPTAIYVTSSLNGWQIAGLALIAVGLIWMIGRRIRKK